MNSSIVRYFTKGTSVTRSPVITKTGWLKCQWCGASPPPDDSPLLGKSRTNMGDLHLLTQLSTCFVLFCDWRIGTLQFSLHTLCSWFLLQLEVINISEYLTTQTPLPPFLPYPRFLLELDLSQTAKMTYVLLLDRATLSQKNLWIDERGFVFVIFTICSLAEQLGRSTVSVSSALKELDAAGLIERRRTRFSSPNHIFVKIPNVE